MQKTLRVEAYMAEIKRPEMLRSNDLRDLLRWTKHTTDNMDRLAATKPFISLARTLSSLTVATATYPFLEFDAVQGSAGELAPIWTADEPDSVYIAEDGLYMVNYSVAWDTSAAGTAKNTGVAVNDYYGPDRETGTLGFVAAQETAAGGYLQVVGNVLLPLVVGDKLQLRVSQSTGGNLDVLAYPQTTFQVARI